MKNWDIIGDIHGHSAKLEGLLVKLGYEASDGVFRHPKRRVLFLGDYIDRGPDVRGVLHIVRAMVDADEAVALAGNHEVNAVHYHTTGRDGEPLRPHSKVKAEQHAATLAQFAEHGDEWQEWLSWFAQLPLFFETDDFRAVHACWSDEHVEIVRGRNLAEREFLFASADKHRAEGRAMEILVKGPELALPPGVTLEDKNGVQRRNMRVRWWDLQGESAFYIHLVMPPGSNAPEGFATSEEIRAVPDYPREAKPVFVGHYWLSHRSGIAPLASNVVCLDYSAGADGPLVACRWNGSVHASEFITSPHADTAVIDIDDEVERFFDDSSLIYVDRPRLVLFLGGIAAGKTTLRRQWFPDRYVVVDAAEIFRNLSRGLPYGFPGPFAGIIDILGRLVVQRAIAERRNIVTELIGADRESTIALYNAMLSIGYAIETKAITCSPQEALLRDAQREWDNISAFHCEHYQRTWLEEAATEFLRRG